TAFRQFENLETALHDEGFVPVGGGMRDEGQYLQAYVVAFGDVDEVFELGSHDVGAADQAVETGLVDDDVEMQRRVRTEQLLLPVHPDVELGVDLLAARVRCAGTQQSAGVVLGPQQPVDDGGVVGDDLRRLRLQCHIATSGLR